MAKLSKTLGLAGPCKQGGKLTIPLLVLVAICLSGRGAEAKYGGGSNTMASAETSTYVFVPDESAVVQTGGIAGVHETYSIEGQFRLIIDFDIGMAWFGQVDANLVDESPFLPTQILGELFNMAALIGNVVDETTIEFEGKTADSTNTDILLRLTFRNDSVHLAGRTVPPPNSADFFIFELDAVAKRKYGGGTGEPNDPYRIATAADIILLGDSPEDYDKHFILMADIDLDPNLPGRKVFNKAVIAPETNAAEWDFQGTAFSGSFDGNDHQISNLTVTGEDYLGLFGLIDSQAEISGLGIMDVNVISAGEYGRYTQNIGGLVGANYGNVVNCYSTGNITGDLDVGGLVGYNRGSLIQCYSSGMITGGDKVGGLVGENMGAVINCYSTCSVTGTYVAGGLVGENCGYNQDGNITNCYSTSVVTGSSYVGGLVGINTGNMINCYSSGAAIGNEAIGGLVGMNGVEGVMPYPGYIDKSYSLASVRGEIFVGGLVGDNRVGDVVQCYSTGTVSGNESVGGLVGLSVRGRVLCSVWDVETSGLSGSTGGVGLTTREMMDPYILGLNGFADDPNWVLDAGLDYPRLAWEGTPGDIIPEPEIDWMEGHGTAQNPYRIDTADQFIFLIGKTSILWDRHFVLGTDIDLDSNLPNVPVFTQALIQVFTGVFDGNDHVISRMTITGASRLGLFGLLESGAEVKDLGVVDVNITSSGGFIGGLVGHNGGGIVNCCYSSGTVIGNWGVGGLGGWNIGAMTQCSSTAAVSGDSTVGGLVGQNLGDVTQCYSTGTVNGGSHVGGLVGRNFGEVTQCYSTGAVNGGSYVGGLVGYEQDGIVTQCYSTGAVSGGGDYVGGLAGGGWSSDMTASFWDTQTSGQITSAGGTGKSTAEMQTAGTFLEAGWDFVDETANGTEDIWGICEGTNYPRLVWQIPAGDFVCPEGITIDDFLFFIEHWRDDNCDPGNDYCDGTDLDFSGTVDANDLEILVENWLEDVRSD